MLPHDGELPYNTSTRNDMPPYDSELLNNTREMVGALQI